MAVRIGVDVGGTFTDVVCFDEDKGQLTLVKVPSTPREPNVAVVQGTERALRENDLAAAAVKFFIHGTTVATNTLLQHKGCTLALVVTEGFRDVLQIMRQDRPRLYDYFVQRPDTLVPRNLRLEVSERMLFSGSVRTPIDETQSAEVIAQIKKAGITDVAVCFLHSYANPEHEKAFQRWLTTEIPGVRVSLSSDILPEFREFERMSTTVVNSYVLPKVSRYFGELERDLERVGIPSRLHIMQSNGGLVPSETARKHCIHTILSGPAAGALSGLRLGQQAGFEDLISIDVGGTSADVAVAHQGRLHFADESEIGGHIIKVPMIEIQTVGAGGGSIAWIDAGGALQAGPQSAGADPGPACYGAGGTEPTVTDANVVLHRLNPDYFLGGEMKISAELATAAIREQIAKPLGLGLEEAAEGILRVINAVMVKAIRRLSVEKGYDPRDFTLISFGGGGPLHAVDLALDLQIPRVLIPPAPGVSSALGLLTADFRHDYVRTLLWKTSEHQLSDLVAELAALKTRGVAQMGAEGIDPNTIWYLLSVDIRYQGQGFGLETNFTFDQLDGWDSFVPLEQKFHRLHEMSFGYSDEGSPTEIVNVRLVGIGELPRPQFPMMSKDGVDPSAARKETRKVYFHGEWQRVNVYERTQLRHGNRIIGPAIIEQRDSTTFFYPEQLAEVDAFGNLIIHLETA
jgi:N-methylhydantoinase A